MEGEGLRGRVDLERYGWPVRASRLDEWLWKLE